MRVLARLLLLAALPALTGRSSGCSGEVVSASEPSPSFEPARTALALPLGGDAVLECLVRRLGDKAVSWVRSRDLQILSHAGMVFTADARVAAGVSGASGTSGASGASLSRHTLRIQGLRASDAGRYECQLNTEPKMSLFYNLTVVDEPLPVAVISARQRAVHAAAGGAASLACAARYEPPPAAALPAPPPLDIRWSKDGQPVSLQSSRGGVSMDTERWAWRAESRLTLAGLTAEDAGEYTCSVEDVADTVMLHVGLESSMEAMQRDQSADSGAPTPRLSLKLTTAMLLVRAFLNT